MRDARRRVDLLPGDIVFTAGSSLLARLIRWGQKSKHEAQSKTNHALIVVGAGRPADAKIVESQAHVRFGTLGQYHGKDYTWVFRAKNVTVQQAGRLAGWSLAQVGLRYGYGQLLLQLIDSKLFRGHNVFRRIAAIDPRPICSRLVATAYRDVLGFDFGVPAYAADPDTLMDFCEAHPEKYELIWDGVPA